MNELIQWTLGNQGVLRAFVRQVMVNGPIWWDKLIALLQTLV